MTYKLFSHMLEDKLTCACKCHFGGAISCPGCKNNHEEQHHCKNCS